MIKHPFPPLYDEHSTILILGSFPSVTSREQMFYYGHPRNRFWVVTAAVFGSPVPGSIDQKKEFLHANHIALWDSIASCDITGSSDSSIKNVTANDISSLIAGTRISRIFCNGRTSYEVYRKYVKNRTLMGAVCLPSTSPANASWSPEKLTAEWRIIRI